MTPCFTEAKTYNVVEITLQSPLTEKKQTNESYYK